ncbi:Mitogen-activated protein kinase kinase kinase kinase [Fasciola gigantica]|uniref:Mitogen-activated protein kinase kinase kinase kinase n=1 Tax=Fasciola gigantica TaxID=46835 RepID=A0A504YVL0_FASGI|nr:Mitogen-activated protein kinase kinase kinase kinase [Fasciola gigantica]
MNHPKLEYLRRFVKENDPKEEYKVLSAIGSGTYGDVFKAIHRATREPVAVKIMKIDLKDDVRSICQEIHTLRECRHPNIVQFYGSYLRNNKLWICMEYCGGQSMQDIYLYTRRPLEEDCIAFVSRETLQGLNFMHERGRIHRDIKGANILLTDDGRVKVADFGVAAQLNNSIGKRTTLIGTPYWMAPEVASIESRGAGYDAKCDIWGVGITAIEYAELQPPMFDLDPRKALQILGTRNYKPPGLQDRHRWSQRFHSFVKCCLVKNERRRPDAATMLTHVFVTNPDLSTLLTQRLLNCKRQLEMRSKMQHQAPQPPQPAPLSPGDQPRGLAPLPQNGQPYANQVLAAKVEDTHSRSPVSIPVNHMYPAQPLPQFVSTKHVLLSNDSRVQQRQDQQKQQSQQEISSSGEVPPGPIGSQSSPEFSSMLSDSRSREVIIERPGFSSESNDVSSNPSPSAVLKDITPPALPPKSARVHSLDRESTAMSSLTVSNAESNGPRRSPPISKPVRPAPPPPVVRIASSRSPNAVAPTKVGGDTEIAVSPQPNENRPLADQLLRDSTEDLLREVMDAFEKRRSCIDPGDPLPTVEERLEFEDENVCKPRELVQMVVDYPMPTEPKQPRATDLSEIVVSPVTGPVRTRSKRRAPPPPPPCASNRTVEETTFSTADAPVYQVVDRSTDFQITAQTDNTRGDDQNDSSHSALTVRQDPPQGPMNGIGQVSLAITDVPPRPPPPKVDPSISNRLDEDDKRLARQHQLEMGIGLPPTPKVHMGACFMLLFEGCPLKVNATATWVNPETRNPFVPTLVIQLIQNYASCLLFSGQVILFGTNDGIYFLNLVDLADGTLELLSSKRCLWLSVLKDTMMSLCGQRPQLYSHNLISLMKSKGTSQPKFLQKRFQPTTKIPDTRGCHIANVIRNPYNGMKYLCGAIDKTIIVMEWYNPRGTFIEVRRVDVPNMPTPVLNFDLIINQDQPLPLVCLGVFATPDPLCYKLHLVNPNDETSNSWFASTLNPEDQLQVIKVVQLEYNTLLICFPSSISRSISPLLAIIRFVEPLVSVFIFILLFFGRTVHSARDCGKLERAGQSQSGGMESRAPVWCHNPFNCLLAR